MFWTMLRIEPAGRGASALGPDTRSMRAMQWLASVVACGAPILAYSVIPVGRPSDVTAHRPFPTRETARRRPGLEQS